MKFYLLIFALIVLSCNEKIFTGNIDCNGCYLDKPDFADLVIDLSVNKKYPAVPVTVYEGDIESNDLVYADTAYATPYYIFVKVGKKYSVKAEYSSSERTIYAINGTNLKTLVVTDACDEKCYVIENDKVDLRLKSEP